MAHLTLVEVNDTDSDRVELENHWKNEHFQIPKHRICKMGLFDGIDRFEGGRFRREPEDPQEKREPLKRAVVMTVSGVCCGGSEGEGQETGMHTPDLGAKAQHYHVG